MSGIDDITPEEWNSMSAKYWKNGADKNVESVRTALHTRAVRGYSKYGTTTERQDLDFQQWMQHLQEELLDAAIYLERMKEEYAKIQRS